MTGRAPDAWPQVGNARGDARMRCPLHDDRHPSCSLSLTRGLWYCFVCGEGGDVIDWRRRVDGLSFHQAWTATYGADTPPEVLRSPAVRRQRSDDARYVAWRQRTYLDLVDAWRRTEENHALLTRLLDRWGCGWSDEDHAAALALRAALHRESDRIADALDLYDPNPLSDQTRARAVWEAQGRP